MVDPNTADYRLEKPTAHLRWYRRYNGLDLSLPVLQQLWQVEESRNGIIHTIDGDWRDIEEAGQHVYPYR